MSPAEVLRKAANVIRNRGHYKGHFSGRDGAVCVFGAINVACGKRPSSFNYNEADHILRAALGYEKDSQVTAWNDAPERTAEEVIATLEKAAKLAESK